MDTTITIEFSSDTKEHLRTLEHLLKHAIRRGFRVIQECHSAFLGTGRAPLVVGGGRGVVRRAGHRQPAHDYTARGRACRGRLTKSLAVAPRAARMRRTIVVGNDRHGKTQGVTGRRAWRTP